ncbi:F-BAR and double SH3 domains protein 2 [Bagarius yarrelli]|uniref:F-BAR and double SH3 domains protein 2 n=1 Tax=Bagarius yarrelli TaxID=175774 RepID=A0A556U3G3_BAGYA|nr:F-BAR and double SH3 domains protein 2 [Bagarius yarrelli]
MSVNHSVSGHRPRLVHQNDHVGEAEQKRFAFLLHLHLPHQNMASGHPIDSFDFMYRPESSQNTKSAVLRRRPFPSPTDSSASLSGYTTGTPYKVPPAQTSGAPPPYSASPSPYSTAMYPIRSAYPQQNLYAQGAYYSQPVFAQPHVIHHTTVVQPNSLPSAIYPAPVPTARPNSVPVGMLSGSTMAMSAGPLLTTPQHTQHIGTHPVTVPTYRPQGYSYVKVSQELKHAHAEQLSKLHLKHQIDCDLLEDLRNICTVWKAYLEGVVKVTQSRIGGCDSYRAQISEPIKTFRVNKEQQLKKSIEQLTRVQAELQDTVKDLTKSRKKYQEAEQMAQAVREKADMEAKSKLSLFQSRSSLKRASVKLKAKRNECNSKATNARNEYLLTLAAANAHQGRYYETDLNSCIKILDGSVYDHMKGYLVSLCQVKQLEKESGTAEEHSLNKEARKWATRVAKEHKNIIHSQRTLSECEGTTQPEQNPCDSELKLEEAKECIRKAETAKLKAEARLNLLRDVGVAVDTWIKSAMNQVMEELENERWATMTAQDASLSSTADFDREEDEETEDTETLDDSSSSPSSTLRNYPLTCKVLYSYQASQPDELTIEEQEVLEVIDDGDMEDWVKARNRAGQVGYVPEKYLQLPSSNSLLSMLQSLAALDTRSYSSNNSTEQEPESANEHVQTSPDGDNSVHFAKALYDYEAQTEDELSFPEGAIIRILSKDNQEDDGFWEGEFNGSVGVFPAVLVEDLATPNGEDTNTGVETQESPCNQSRPPRPLSMTQYQPSSCSSPVSSPLATPTLPSPISSPASSSGSHLASPRSLNGYHRPAPAPPKAASNSHAHSSTPPPKYPSDSRAGTLRPVRAAPPPPPPKQQAQGQVQKKEEVEITLV